MHLKITCICLFSTPLSYSIQQVLLGLLGLSLSLVGELVGARLISHAGSLMNLAKHPASTVQILGAEKALFKVRLHIERFDDHVQMSFL